MKKVFILSLLFAWSSLAGAAPDWTEALQAMPVTADVRVLNHSNCAQVVLGAFQSNATVKAIIFMPGATDELYFFRRVSVPLTNSENALLPVLQTLTNGSHLRLEFRRPFLLIHSAEDLLELNIGINKPETVGRLKAAKHFASLKFLDADWDRVLDAVQSRLKVTLEPWKKTRGSWHFYRHTFAAFDLDQWETLEAIAYAGKTQFTVNRSTARFELDPRFGELPKLEQFPPKR